MIFVHLRRPRTAALALSLAFIGNAALGQTAPALHMRALAATCANCHGTEGGAVQGEAMARLAGLPIQRHRPHDRIVGCQFACPGKP